MRQVKEQKSRITSNLRSDWKKIRLIFKLILFFSHLILKCTSGKIADGSSWNLAASYSKLGWPMVILENSCKASEVAKFNNRDLGANQVAKLPDDISPPSIARSIVSNYLSLLEEKQSVAHIVCSLFRVFILHLSHYLICRHPCRHGEEV